MRAWTVLVLLATSWLAGAHMVEVPAGKKECFFEDLHVNDKVSRQHLPLDRGQTNVASCR